VATKLTRLTHKIAIQLHLVAESYRATRPVRKLLDTQSYLPLFTAVKCEKLRLPYL